MMKIKVIISAFIAAIVLSGCGGGDIQIFKDEDAKYRPEALSNADLENDTYYIKTGTKFYEAYKADTSGGAGKKEHFRDTFINGKSDAALAASVFHFGEISIPELKQYLHSEGINVRI